MNTIKCLFTKPNSPPVVFIPPIFLDEQAMQRLATELGFRYIIINGSAISIKEDLFDHLSNELNFPEYFGHNWDALLDCLRDLDSWLPAKGYVLFYKNPNNLIMKSLSEFKTFLEIVEEASEFWNSQGVRFMLIVEGNEDLIKLLSNHNLS